MAGQLGASSQQQHRDADHPGAARQAEGAGEEDAAQRHDRRDEHASEAQWWVWRTSSPATSKEIRIAELNASVTGWPCSGAWGPGR